MHLGFKNLSFHFKKEKKVLLTDISKATNIWNEKLMQSRYSCIFVSKEKTHSNSNQKIADMRSQLLNCSLEFYFFITRSLFYIKFQEWSLWFLCHKQEKLKVVLEITPSLQLLPLYQSRLYLKREPICPSCQSNVLA